jgi:hypothetical protein
MKNRDPMIASTHVHGHQELSIAFGFTQAALEKFHGFNHVHVAHYFAQAHNQFVLLRVKQ